MIKFYFLLNAALYLLFALWCTFGKEQTAKASGYLTLNNAGWSEYLVIYGGLQLGLAGFFAYLATHAEYFKVGVIFSVMLYIGIVTFRLISMYAYWPMRKPTLMIAGMEVLLLVGAIAAFIMLQQQR
jgi:hypothetical protein